jgi:hypothetical protein
MLLRISKTRVRQEVHESEASLDYIVRTTSKELGMVVHTCNPSYSRDGEWANR